MDGATIRSVGFAGLLPIVRARLVAKLHCEYQSGPPLLGDIPFCVAYVFVWCDAGRSGISSMVGEIREFFGNTAGDAVLGDGPVSEK